MAMNPSQLLTSIKMDLGIYGLRLPFDNPDQAMMDVIKLKTLKTFSSFYPHVIQKTVNLNNDFKCLKEEYTESIYVIPDMFGDREIMYVRNIYLKNKLLGNGYLAPVFDGSIDTYNMLMMTQANANLASVAAPAITFKFVPPNRLHLYNVATAYGEIDIEFGVEHADNFSTIPITAWESFYELALLDIKRFLYNAMKHYTELQTAHGTISLKIQDWENAESERRDYIEKMRDIYHLEIEQLFII